MADAEVPETSFDAEPAELDGPRHRGSRKAIAVAAALLLVVAAVALLVNRGAPTAEEELAEVRTFIAEQRTARVSGTFVYEYGPGDDELGSTSTDRSRLDGVVRIPDASRVVEDDGDFVTETLVIGGDTYTRESDSGDDLSALPWIFSELLDEELVPEDELDRMEELSDDELAALSQAVAGFSGLGLPLDLADALGRGDTVTRIAPGELRVEMEMRDLIPDSVEEDFELFLEGMGEEVDIMEDPVTLTVTAGPEGRLDRLVMESETETEGETEVQRLDLSFTRWGDPVDIAAPGDSQLDRTPDIDEEGLADFDTFPVLAPTQLPEGYLLSTLTADPEDEEYEMCASVSLGYTPGEDPPPFDPDDDEAMVAAEEFWARQISIEQTDTSYEFHEEPDLETEGRPVVVGGRSATVHDEAVGYNLLGIDPDDGPAVRSVILQVGDVSIVLSSALPEAELLRAAASLAPLDLAAQPIVIADLPER